MTHALRISSRDELISFIPHALGFDPQGMVCLATGGGPIARLDLPDSADQMEPWIETLTDVFLHRHHPSRVALVAFGEDGPACVDALSALGEALANVEHPGPDVGPMLWVNGDQWTDLIDGTTGEVDPSTRARIDAEFALLGRVMPTGGRDDLAAALQGDPTAVARQLPAAQARVLAMDATARLAEIEWLRDRLDQFRHSREFLTDDDTARVLAVIQDDEARDHAAFRISRKNSPVYSEFWQDLVRRAPAQVRDTPATLLALSSYLEGRGAQAWVALDQLSQSGPLSRLIAAALEQAVDPREWDSALSTAAGAVMQQAALRDMSTTGLRAQERPARETPEAASVDPDTPPAAG
jgi:hypothetical protein